ncbi:hypothetical protein KCP73_04585 [Salmonella enterica subsp. enterica]|nr:hypothetical protein KCP73_04585 [Salmonella enterica subsp. enterica]
MARVIGVSQKEAGAGELTCFRQSGRACALHRTPQQFIFGVSPADTMPARRPNLCG